MSTLVKSNNQINRLNELLRKSIQPGKAPNRFRLILVSVMVVITAGLFYFYYYQKIEGQKFDERRFRILRVIEENIAKKEAGYTNVIQEFSRDLKNMIAEDDTAEKFMLNSWIDDKQKSVSGIIISDVNDALEIPGYYFLSPLGDRFDAIVSDSMKHFMYSQEDTQLGVYINLRSYFDALIPKKTFDDIVILESDSTGRFWIKFQNLDNGLIFDGSEIDSLIPSSSGFHAGTIHESIEIHGEKYRMYVHIANPLNTISSSAYFSNGTKTSYSYKQKIICGLVKNETFEASKRQVSIWWIIILSIVLIIIIVSLPLLKIYLVNDYERLKSSDVVLTGMSVIIGAPLILLILLALAEYSGYYLNEQTNDLEHIAVEIDSSLTREINDVLLQINEFTQESQSIKNDFISREDTGKTRKLSRSELESIASKYDHFNEFFGLDSTGMQKFSLTTYSEEKNLISLSERGYYQNLVKGNSLTIPDIDVPFVMESVSSWTTGNHEFVIGVKCDSDRFEDVKFLAMSSRPVSVMNPIFRTGYGFTIIDKYGNTWFNSNQSRINSENFLEEVGNNSEIKSAIFGNQKVFTQTTYWGERVRIHVKPSQNLPLYIVTYYEIQNARSFISEIASLCVVFILVGFILVGVLVFSTAFLEKETKLFRMKSFAFDWLRPKDKNLNLYMVSRRHMIFNGICFIGMVFWIALHEESLVVLGPNIVAMGVIFPSLTFVSNYWIYNLFKINAPFEKKKLTIFVHVVIIVIYVLVIHSFVYNSVFYWVFVSFWLLTTIISLVIIGVCSFHEFKTKNVNDDEKTGAFGRLITKSNKALKIKAVAETRQELDRSYFLYIYSWLIIVSLIPLFVVFGLTQSMEEYVYSKYEMVRLAESIETKHKQLSEEFRSTVNESLINKKSFYYQFNNLEAPYMDRIEVSLDLDVKDPLDDSLHAKTVNWFKILKHLRPKYHPSLRDSKSLLALRSENDKWNSEVNNSENKISYTLDRPIGDCKEVNLHVKFDENDELSLLGPLKSENFFLTGGILLFIASLFVLIAIIVRYLYRTIFSINFMSFKPYKPGDKELAELKDCILICSSQKTKDQIKKKKPLHLDLDLFLDELMSAESQQARLNSLEIAFSSNLKLLVTSRYPSVLVDLLDRGENELIIEKERLMAYISRYQQIIYCEINEHMEHVEKVKKDEKDEEDDDLIIWELQRHNYHYYRDIWSSASARERYILYDLAEDEFANTKNSNAVLYLIAKGIIQWDEQLKFFNEGFRNFILTVIKPKEGRQIEKEMSARGSWQVVRFILLGIIALLVTFIAMGEPEFFSDFNTVLTLVASVVTLFPVIGTLFSVQSGG